MSVRRRLLLPVLILLLIGVPAAAAQAAPASVEVTQTLVVGGNEVQSQTIPAGSAALTVLIRYRCSSSTTPCKNAQIALPIPNGVSPGNIDVSADVASVDVVGSQRVIVMKPSLAAGTTGSMTMTVAVPGWSTPNNSNFSWKATMGADNADPVDSATISITARAQGTTSATAALDSGGAVGDIAAYTVGGCAAALSDPDYGPLGVQTGGSLVVTLPAGATVVESGGGVYAAGTPATLTFDLGFVAGGCASKGFRVSYPTSNPANVAGATKAIGVTFRGRKVGSASTTTLGTANASHPLTVPVVTDDFAKSIAAPRSVMGVAAGAIGDEISYTMAASNSGTQTFDGITVSDTVPAILKATTVVGNNFGRSPGSLWVASRRGPDHTLGTGDDDTLIKVADIPAGEQRVYTVYTGGTALPSNDWVTRVEVRIAEIYPGTGGAVAQIAGQILATDHNNVVTGSGTTFSNTASFALTVDGSTSTTTRIANGVVDVPTPGVTVRHGGGYVPTGSREADFDLNAAPVWGDDLADIVFVVELPAHVTLKSWTGPAGLPTATLTQIPNWDGAGSRLLRWTFPAGTIALKNTGYTINYRVLLDRTVFTPRTVKGWISQKSATRTIPCGDNWFDGSQDTADKDGDGNTTEVLCPWFSGLSFQTSSSAVLTQGVKGSWDSDFIDGPGTGNTEPAHNDNYRLNLDSQATMNLEHVQVIDVLPRPGDTAVITSTQRNPSTGTFPVHLRARPTVPTLGSAVTTYYSTAVDPCRPELNYSPSGCNAPNWVNWDSVAPSSLSAVTAVRFDFGSNLLVPGDRWTIDLPVTTPASGATEPDFAVVNPDPASPETDERAYNSSGFIVARADLHVDLLPSESQAVGLDMPSIEGPPGERPTAAPRTTTGVGLAPHSTTVSIPAGGSVALMDGLTPVGSLHVANVGDYTINTSTGEIQFQPVLGFQGPAPAVPYRRRDIWGQSAVASYVATVTPPAAPAPPNQTSTGTGATPHTVPVTAPTGGSFSLVDPNTGEPITTRTVTGVGTYTVTSGGLRFVPVTGYHGTPPAVTYAVVDAYGQETHATYGVTVIAPDQAPADPGATTAPVGTVQSFVITVPDGGSVTLIDADGNDVDTLTVAGEGTYVLHPSGVLTFTPEPGFTGASSGVKYKVTDVYGRSSEARYTPTVTKTPDPVADPPLTLAPRVCTSRRVMVVNFKVTGARALSVSINGKFRKLGAHTRKLTVDLRGLTAKQTVTVQLTARLRGGKTVRAQRVYRTCVGTLKSDKPLTTLKLR